MTDTERIMQPDQLAATAPPTPAMAPAATTFRVRMTGGTEYGPANLEAIVQWAREGRIPRDALLYPATGGEPKSVFAEPRLAAILSAPPTMRPEAGAISSAKMSFWMPTGNQPALWGYYIGVVCLIPPLIVLAPISLILGVVGMVRAFTKPEAKGPLPCARGHPLEHRLAPAVVGAHRVPRE